MYREAHGVQAVLRDQLRVSASVKVPCAFEVTGGGIQPICIVVLLAVSQNSLPSFFFRQFCSVFAKAAIKLEKAQAQGWQVVILRAGLSRDCMTLA